MSAHPFRIAALLLALITLPLSGRAESILLPLDDGSEIPIHRFAAKQTGEKRTPPDRLLWITAEYGLRTPAHPDLAAAIAATDMEVWLADLHAGWFLIPGPSSYTEIDPLQVAELIAAAIPEHGQLYVMSAGRGAALLLMALREWQRQHPESTALGGAILLHPNLMARPPEAGSAATYLPITYATRLPIYLIQPQNSAKRWYLTELADALVSGGSALYFQLLPDASDGFQSRHDTTERERQLRTELPALIVRARQQLQHHNRQPWPAVATLPAVTDWQAKPQATAMQPYPDRPIAPNTQLQQLDGTQRLLSEYRGQVVLLNFWATWCPPCVKEIPSLGRLQALFADRGLVVVGADVGESRAEVEQFLQRVPARYPILLDPAGSAVAPWQLRAFPTTFLIDREGHIRYGYFGALEWDAAPMIALIESLL